MPAGQVQELGVIGSPFLDEQDAPLVEHDDAGESADIHVSSYVRSKQLVCPRYG
jgi:hypothetical protein